MKSGASIAAGPVLPKNDFCVGGHIGVLSDLLEYGHGAAPNPPDPRCLTK